MDKIEINNYEFNGKNYNELYELLEDMSKNWEDAIEHINTPLLETALAECGEKSIYNKFIMSKTVFYEEIPKFLHIMDFMLKSRLEKADKAISAFRKNDAENKLLINLLPSHDFMMLYDNPKVITDMYVKYPQNVIDFTNEFKKAILSRRTSILKAFIDICVKPKSIGSDLAYEVDNSDFDEKTKELGTEVLKKLIEIKNSISDDLQKINDEAVAQAAKNKNPGQVSKIIYAKTDIPDSKLADVAEVALNCDFKYYGVFKNPFFKINEEYQKIAKELHLFYFLNSVVDNEVFSYKDICCQNIKELKEYIFNSKEKLQHPKYKYIALFMLCYAMLQLIKILMLSLRMLF